MNRFLLLTPLRTIRVASTLLTRVSPLHSQIKQINTSSIPANTEKNQVSIPRRIKRFLDENPFTQIALLVCILVVGVASLVEWTQNKRRLARFGGGAVFPSLPPKPQHPVFAMEDEVALIMQQVPGVTFSATRMVSIVGGRGAGKSELARQVAEAIMHREKRMYRRDPHILTLDISNRDTLSQSLLRSAALLQLPQSCLTNIGCDVMSDESVAEVLSALNQRLKKKQVVCIIENATNANLQENAKLFSKQFWNSPSLFIITSRQPIQKSVNLEVNIDSKKLDKDRLTLWIEQFANGESDTINKLASIFSKIPTNFEAFSLICHCITLLGGEKIKSVNGDNLDSIVNSLCQQLPEEIEREVDSLGYRSLEPLRKLQLLALTLFSASNQLNQHSVDFLAKLSPAHFLPLSTLITYLESPFLELEKHLRERRIIKIDEFDNGSEQKEANKPESEMGYWEFIKHTWKKRKEMIEMLKKQQQKLQTINKLDMPIALQAVKESPLFLWEYDVSNGFESVKFRNEELHRLASGIFQRKTIPQMEKTTVNRARSLHTSSLLSKLSTFNPALHLIKYRAALPGVSKSVHTSDHCATHTRSLMHRIILSLVKDFGIDGEQVKHRLISQQGDHMLRTDANISSEDRVKVLRLRASLLKYEDKVTSALAVLREIASIQEANQSTPLVELARTYSQIGKLTLLQMDTATGHAYYEQAANLYERAINKLTPAQQVEYGSLLYRYGVEMSYDKKLDTSKICLEKSLAILNLAISQSPTTIGQTKLQLLVLSSMVELAHVYLALGAHSYAEKLLNMADTMSKTVGGIQDNPDLAQLYNLKAVLKSLSGDKQGYVQLKQQAGDVLAAVENKPFVY